MTRDQVVAIVRLGVMFVAAVLSGIGIAIDADALYNLIALAVALIAGIVSWWKNSNMTEAAQEAQAYLDNLKAAKEEGE